MATAVAIAGLTTGALTLAVAGSPDTVAVRLFQFQPKAVEVTAGTVVRWTNHDDIEHTVTSGAPDRPAGRFAVRLPARGASAAVSFAEPGVHHYFCERHPSMRGEIRVN
jgi:plastocyanin